MSDFTGLPVGTMMLVKAGWTGTYLRPIEKVCKKYIVCAGSKWGIDGFNSQLGAGRWSRSTIQVATPEDIATVKHAQAAYYLKEVKWADLPMETLTAVLALLPAGAATDE